MAILQQREDVAQDQIGQLNQNQKLLSNKSLMLKNFKEVIENLNDCESYIQDVIDGKRPDDSNMGRLLETTMSEFSSDDMSVLENLIASNFEDALMIASLSRLQQQQLRISEKLNTVFSETVVKSQQTP